MLQVISGAGHHVYADKSDIFNQHVEKACQMADESSNFEGKNDKLDTDCNAGEPVLSQDSLNKDT